MDNTKYENILISKEKQITKIILNRPDKLNAISPGFIEDLYKALPIIENDSDTRAVVITGSGRAFSAGGDIQEDLIPVSGMTPMEWKAYIKNFCEVIKKIYYMAKPVIAAINGVTVGGGCDLAMSCDIRIASDKAKFGHGYIRMGIISDMGGHFFLPRIVGTGKAKLLAFTGDLIDATEAERIGLVDRVVPADEFEKGVDELVQKIANGPTTSIVFIKEAMQRSSTMSLEASLDYSLNLQSALLASEDLKEGINSFLEKRKPNFMGK